MVDWSKIGDGSYEKLPKLNEELKKEGSSVTVVFMDDGKDVPAEVMAKAYTKKGVKGIKAQDMYVFEVEHATVKKCLFIGSKSYTNLRELAAIAKANKGTLVGAKVKITRIAENDPNTSNYKYESA